MLIHHLVHRMTLYPLEQSSMHPSFIIARSLALANLPEDTLTQEKGGKPAGFAAGVANVKPSFGGSVQWASRRPRRRLHRLLFLRVSLIVHTGASGRTPRVWCISSDCYRSIFLFSFSLWGNQDNRATPGNYYGVFERRLNGGRWTFSRDLVPQEGTGRRSGLL